MLMMLKSSLLDISAEGPDRGSRNIPVAMDISTFYNLKEKRMKEYEELRFNDDFMFCKILQKNEDLCKELTELVIGRKIGTIVKSERQKAIEITADGHGVRFDVFFEDDEKRVYNIEMNTVVSPCRLLDSYNY